MTTTLITLEEIEHAARMIRGHVLRTPTVASPGLSALLQRPVYLKLESLQMSGCFKPRGITAKVLSLPESERSRGIVAFSGGNHGIAMSEIGRTMGIPVTVVMPESAPEASKARVRANGANLIIAADVAEAYEISRAESERGLTYVHPYADATVMAGQGTLGLEFIEDAPALTDVLVSIGGGALIGGVATAVKAVKPGVRVWGVETQGADAMSMAFDAGGPVDVKVSSLATTLGAPNVSDLSYAHARQWLEAIFVIPDRDAVAGVIDLAEHARIWVEPAAGCLLPAARQVLARVGPEAVLGLVMCGGNVSYTDLARWTTQFALV